MCYFSSTYTSWFLLNVSVQRTFCRTCVIDLVTSFILLFYFLSFTVVLMSHVLYVTHVWLTSGEILRHFIVSRNSWLSHKMWTKAPDVHFWKLLCLSWKKSFPLKYISSSFTFSNIIVLLEFSVCLIFCSSSFLVIKAVRGIGKASSWTGIVCWMHL